MQRSLIIALAVVIGAGSMWVYAATVGDPRDPPAVLPYRGFLQKDEVPVSGEIELGFALYASPSPSPAIWSDAPKKVQVSAGQFNVTLGSDANPIPRSVFAGGAPVEIGITVVEGGVATQLVGRQRIHPVAYAVSAANANHSTGDFTVGGNLTVAGTTKLTSVLDIEGVARFGFDTHSGTPRTLFFKQDAGDEINAGSITYKPSYGNQSLGIVGAGKPGERRSVMIWDDLEVKGGLKTSCRPGFMPVADGRICMRDTNETSQNAWNAVAVCKVRGPGSRVCTHTDWQQACAGGFVSGRGADAGWYGDLADGDDWFQIWNSNSCDANNTGGARPWDWSLPYRCCY
jgi:hypothetical protein